MDHQPPNMAAYNNTQGTTASGYPNTHTDHAHHSASTHGTLNHPDAHKDHAHNTSNTHANLNHANALPGGAHSMPTYGDSPTTGPAAHTAGHHKHDMLNKLDPSVDSSRDKVQLPPPGGAGATNGPHHSRLANKLDMTVDSQAYERNHLGTSAASTTYQNASVPDPTHNGHLKSGGGLMSGGGGSAPEGTYGPHGSRVANAADPRVDSDRDGHGHQQGVGAGYGQGGTLQSGLGHQQGHNLGGSVLPGPAPNTAGPHKSDAMNKLDPKVDSSGGMVNEMGQRRGL